MRPPISPLDAALNRFAAVRAEAARRDRERRYCEVSRTAVVLRHGERPTDPEAAALIADLDRRIARLRGW